MLIREATSVRLWGGPRHWEIIIIPPGEYPSNVIRAPYTFLPQFVPVTPAGHVSTARPPIATYFVDLAADGTPKLNPGIMLPNEKGIGAAMIDLSGPVAMRHDLRKKAKK